MNVIVLAALLQAVAPAEAKEVVLGGFRTVGLSEGESATYRARLEEELAAVGVRLVEPELPLDPSCYDELECLEAAPAGKDGLVDVELVRVGPFLQVKFRLWGAEAEALLDEEGMQDADALASGGALVPAELVERIGASGQPLESLAPPPSSVTEELVTAPVEQPDDPEGVPVLGYSGIGVAVLGGALLVGGGLLALSEMAVLENATTLGPEKERARVLGPSALVAAGVGAVVLGGGGALATLGFAGE